MNSTNQPDILLFFSDQHDGRVMGCAGHPVVSTPHLDALAKEGTLFENAYTSCPLCVPARMSLLTGQLPIHTGVYTNRGSIHPEMPTFLHNLALAGYETVLCGRMHFEGDDQFHGFTRRIAGDITPTAIGGFEERNRELGPMGPTLTELGCIHVVGGGNSPTLEYDRYVTASALEYLSCPHTKPQFIVVGTYGPHFPYVAPPELYEKYLPLTKLPPTLNLPLSTPDSKRTCDTSPELIRHVQAAYWGMVEFEDQCVGLVKDAWEQYLNNNRRTGIFAYSSDHGDHAGDRGFYGKQSLFEAALRIPMIISGHGVKKNWRLKAPVSILDFAPTFCKLGKANPLPASDGISLIPALTSGYEDARRPVIAEWINLPYQRGTDYGRMARIGEWKLASYSDYPNEEILTRPDLDPWELNNEIDNYPEIADQLRLAAYEGIEPAKIVAEKNQRDVNYAIIEAFNRQRGVTNKEIWPVSEAAKSLPDHYICTSQPIPERFQKTFKKRSI